MPTATQLANALTYNPFYSADTNKQLLAAQQQAALANALLGQGLEPINQNNRQIGNVATRISPWEGVAKLVQTATGLYGEKKARDAYANAFTAPEQQAPSSPSLAERLGSALSGASTPEQANDQLSPIEGPQQSPSISGVTPQPDPLTQYRQDNGMQRPPIDAQRAGMGLPVGSQIMQPQQSTTGPSVNSPQTQSSQASWSPLSTMGQHSLDYIKKLYPGMDDYTAFQLVQDPTALGRVMAAGAPTPEMKNTSAASAPGANPMLVNQVTNASDPLVSVVVNGRQTQMPHSQYRALLNRQPSTAQQQIPPASASINPSLFGGVTPPTVGGLTPQEQSQLDIGKAAAESGAKEDFGQAQKITNAGNDADTILAINNSVKQLQSGNYYDGKTGRIKDDVANTLSSLGITNPDLTSTANRTEAIDALLKRSFFMSAGLAQEEGQGAGGMQIRNLPEFQTKMSQAANLDTLPGARDIALRYSDYQARKVANNRDALNEFYAQGNQYLNHNYLTMAAQKNANLPSPVTEADIANAIGTPSASPSNAQMTQKSIAKMVNGVSYQKIGGQWFQQ